jgi:hypothetical protein
MAGFVYGKTPLEAMEAYGAITLAGERRKARVFQTLFALPPKAPVPVQ